MRKLIFAINTSLDGCCEHTKFNPDDDILEHFTQLTSDADTFVYGRKTYELMIPYWPDIAKNPTGQRQADIQFARAFDAVKKIIVCSQSLDKAEGNNISIIRTGLRDELLKLKQQEGKNILTGGVNIPSQLMELGLVDEYHFVIHPIIAGQGARLLEGIGLQYGLQLALIGSKTFKNGAVALRYLKQ